MTVEVEKICIKGSVVFVKLGIAPAFLELQFDTQLVFPHAKCLILGLISAFVLAGKSATWFISLRLGLP